MNVTLVENRFWAAWIAVAAACMAFAGARADEAAIVQPFVSETTVVAVKVDLKRVSLPDLAEQLKSQPANVQKAYQGLAAKANAELDRLRSAAGGQPLYATIGVPHSRSNWPAFLFLKAPADAKLDALLAHLGDAKPSQRTVRGEWTIISPIQGADVGRLLETSPPSPRPELAGAFAAVADYPVQVLLLPPDYVRTTVRDLLPRLPQQLGGGPSELLTDGLMWAALGVDPSRLTIDVVVQSASDGAARELADALPTLLRSLFLVLPDAPKRIAPESIEKLLSLIKPEVAGDRITVRLDTLAHIDTTVGFVAAIAGGVSEELDRQTDRDRFRQIVIAMHNHHDVHGTFPPAKEFRDASGASKLSWRVHILPFVEQTPLYQQFRLDEAWDSPHNKPLVEKMPDIFKSGSRAGEIIKPGHTIFLAPTGNGAVFGGSKAAKFQDIQDGTSNTVVLVEVKPELAVPWTAPADYAFDPQSPGSGLQAGSDGRFLAAFADSSVEPLRADAPPEMLLRLFQMNDGEVIARESLR
jgi:hypothetical protein